MLTEQDLKGLIAYRPGKPVLSVYLNVDPSPMHSFDLSNTNTIGPVAAWRFSPVLQMISFKASLCALQSVTAPAFTTGPT